VVADERTRDCRRDEPDVECLRERGDQPADRDAVSALEVGKLAVDDDGQSVLSGFVNSSENASRSDNVLDRRVRFAERREDVGDQVPRLATVPERDVADPGSDPVRDVAIFKVGVEFGTLSPSARSRTARTNTSRTSWWSSSSDQISVTVPSATSIVASADAGTWWVGVSVTSAHPQESRQDRRQPTMEAVGIARRPCRRVRSQSTGRQLAGRRATRGPRPSGGCTRPRDR
jgi:hypothetical protein